jgi:hypothetical protein
MVAFFGSGAAACVSMAGRDGPGWSEHVIAAAAAQLFLTALRK